MTDNYTQDFIDEVKGAMNSGGGTIDQTARINISNHIADMAVHVTADEKAAWSGKADKSGVLNYLGVVPDLFAVNKTCVCTYDFDTLNTPLKAGVTNSGGGLCFINCENGAEYVSYLVMPSGDPNVYSTNSMNGALHGEWKKINDGGNADTLDGFHENSFLRFAGYWNSGDLLDKVKTYNRSGLAYCSSNVTGTPVEGEYFMVDIQNSGGTIGLTATRFDTGETYSNRYNVSSKSWYGWKNLADGGNSDTVDGLHASDIQIDSVSDTAGIVALDGLQGEVLFSEIVVSGKNIFYGQLVAGMVGTTTGVIDSTSPDTTRYLSTTNLIPVKPNTQYTAQNTENKTLDAVVYYDENESLIGHTYISAAGFNSFTTPDNCKFVRWRYLFDSVQSDTSGLTNIQFEVGGTATEYEPPIIGQEITLTACGKNLIPYPYSRGNGIYNGITINISDDGKFSASGVATAGFTLITFANQDKPIKLVAGRIYTISCSKPYDINNFNLYFRIYHTDGTYSGVTSYPTTFIAKDGDYITGSLWVDEGTSFNVSNVSIQIELGDTATEYEPYSGSTITVTPDSNPYIVPNDIRQRDGTNTVSVSIGEISVTGVKKNAAIKKIWDNKADLSDIPIDVVSDTAELVTLDGLQGGVPFSSITVSGRNLITQVLSAALGGNSTDGFRITDNPYCRSFVRKLLPNTTYTVKRYDNGNRFRIILFNEYPTITADTTANQILNATTTTPNEWTFTTGTDHLWFALTTHNGATDNTVVEPIVQLEYGDTATEYEPPIVGQEITLTTCGKNLIPYPYYHSDMTVHGVTISDNGDGSITVNGTATDNVVFYFAVRTTGKMILPNGEYFVSGCPKNSDLRIDVSYTNDSGTASELVRDSGNGAGFTMPYSAPLSVGLVIFSGKTYDHITVRPQLERGDNATEYKLYSGSTITITPDSNPYTVPNDIRQREGINNVSVSAGEVTVTGVRRNAAVRRIWDKLDELTVAIIVSNGETTE